MGAGGYLKRYRVLDPRAVVDVRTLVSVGDKIAGFSGQVGAFVLDTETGNVRLYPSVAAALARFVPVPKLQTPDQFYRSRRFGWQDIAALLVLLGLLATTSWLWFQRALRPQPGLPLRS